MFNKRYIFPRYPVPKLKEPENSNNKKAEENMQQDMTPVRSYEPMLGTSKISREEVAKYFNRSGKGLNVRLDIPLLTAEDLKWVAAVFSDLARDLVDMAYDNERPEILRIMEGRYLLYGAQHTINDKNKKSKVRELNLKLRTGQKIAAPTKRKKLSKIKGGGGGIPLKTPSTEASPGAAAPSTSSSSPGEDN